MHLSQLHGDIEFPVAYASKTFTKGKSNKSTIEQELTAIHWAINYFRPYLYGRRFTVKTDHRPLVYLFSMKNPSSKLTRMRIDLEEFTFDVEHISGKENVGADALSRVVFDSEELKTLSVLPIQTRYMTRKRYTENNTDLQSDSSAIKTDHPKAYESVNNRDAFNIPKVIFEINHNTLSLQIQNKTLKRILAREQLFYKNEINLQMCLQTLNEMASKTNIKTLALKNDDKIFTMIPRESFKEACNKVLKNLTIVIYQPAQIVTDDDIIQKIISENHDTPTGGHIGTSRLLNRLRSKYYWHNMKQTIANFIKLCVKCSQNKHKVKTNETFVETTTPIKCFDLISIDTIGPFTKSRNGNRYALTVQCDLSKYIIAASIPDRQAGTLAKALVEHCILIHGCPNTIKSDLGTEYKNEIFENVCKMLSIQQKFSTSYHPETIGSLERNHRCLNEYLRSFINEEHDDWDSWLSYYTFCYNTTSHSDHSYTPFEIVFGKLANVPSQFLNVSSIDPIYNYESYINELKYKLQHASKKAKDLLEKAKAIRIQNQIPNSNPIYVTIGDKFWLKKEKRRKLDSVYDGPFEIVKIMHPNVRIKNTINQEEKTVHKNRIVLHSV